MRYRAKSHPGITETLQGFQFTDGISDEHLSPSTIERFHGLGVELVPYPEDGVLCPQCEEYKKEIARLKKSLKVK